MLSAERAGYKLVTALVSTLVSYLVGTVELNDTSVRSPSCSWTSKTKSVPALYHGTSISSYLASYT